MTTDIDPEIKETLDEHIAWITAVIADAAKRGAPAITEAIGSLRPDQLPGMLFVVLSAYVGDHERIREAMREQIARAQFDCLDDNGSTLH